MSKINVTPIETGTPERKRLAFQGPYGVIAEYILLPVGAGTSVEVRRRKMIADGYGDARKCYAG